MRNLRHNSVPAGSSAVLYLPWVRARPGLQAAGSW